MVFLGVFFRVGYLYIPVYTLRAPFPLHYVNEVAPDNDKSGHGRRGVDRPILVWDCCLSGGTLFRVHVSLPSCRGSIYFVGLHGSLLVLDGFSAW